MVQVVVRLAFVLSLLGAVDGEYACLCNYAEETPVYTDHRNDSSVIGYMYEFDCKPIAETSTESREFAAVQFEKSLGYVPFSEATEKQTCDGSVPLDDQIPQTTQPITETTYSTIWTSDWVTTPTELTTPPTEPDKPTTVPTAVYVTGLEWPAGTYGLMKAAQGCPDDSWKSGWREQDTEDFNTINNFSDNINMYLAGSFGDDIVTEFCIKDNSEGHNEWPAGSYCILKKNDCPTGFSQGFIFWDDEDLLNANDKGGTLPDGEFGRNTRIDYCCRDDGDVNQEVALPTEHAFVLIRYSTQCQWVRGMLVTDVHVRWDDDDGFLIFSGHTSDAGGMHPLDEDPDEGHLLHFCHYQLPPQTAIG